jgi:hypothetical protein
MILTKLVAQNARFSIRDNLDPDSNVTEDSDPHSEKQHSHKTSTNEGTMISTKLIPKNAHPSIRDNLDPDSNVTDESDLHPAKQL